MLELDGITADVLSGLRDLFLGSESLAVTLMTVSVGYVVSSRASDNFFIYIDPSGDVVRAFFLESSSTIDVDYKSANPGVDVTTVMEQCSAIGFYAKSEHITPGEWVVYKIHSRRPPIGGALRMWDFHCVKGEIWTEP